MSAKTFMLTLVGVSGAGWLWSRGGAASQRDGDDEPLEEEQGESQFPSMDKQRCEDMIGRALERNITVKFMVEKLGEVCCVCSGWRVVMGVGVCTLMGCGGGWYDGWYGG